MLNEIFGSCPQVKVIDYLLAHPFDTYTKQQIAVGAGISRSTLDNFIENLIKSDFLITNESKRYSINTKSNIVKMLDKIQYELAMKEFEKQAKTFDEDIITYTDAEIDKMFPTDVPDINLNEVEKEIEENEKILVNKKEYSSLKNNYNLKKDSIKASKNFILIDNEKFKDDSARIHNCKIVYKTSSGKLYHPKKHSSKNKDKNILNLGNWDTSNTLKKIIGLGS